MDTVASRDGEVRGGLEAFAETATASLGFLLRIQLLYQLQKAAVKIVHRHVARANVDVEQGAFVPRAIFNKPALTFETVIKGRARESSQKSHLHFVKAGLANKIEHVVEYLRRIAVETHDKTAVDGNAVRLDFFNRGFVAVLLAHFPVSVQLDAIEALATRTLQADQDLLAT